MSEETLNQFTLREKEIISYIDLEKNTYIPSKLRMGKHLLELHDVTATQGRNSKFSAALRLLEIKRSTAYDLINAYKFSVGLITLNPDLDDDRDELEDGTEEPSDDDMNGDVEPDDDEPVDDGEQDENTEDDEAEDTEHGGGGASGRGGKRSGKTVSLELTGEVGDAVRWLAGHYIQPKTVIVKRSVLRWYHEHQHPVVRRADQDVAAVEAEPLVEDEREDNAEAMPVVANEVETEDPETVAEILRKGSDRDATAEGFAAAAKYKKLAQQVPAAAEDVLTDDPTLIDDEQISVDRAEKKPPVSESAPDKPLSRYLYEDDYDPSAPASSDFTGAL